MDNLKPCPFCRSKQTIEEIAQDGVPGYMLKHMCCMIRPSWWTIKEEAIKAWNTRAERTCHHVDDGIEWVDEEFCCSECGCTTSLTMSSLTVISDGELNYCPNCGARIIDRAVEE